VTCMGYKTNPLTVMAGAPEGKSPLGRARRRWKTNVKLDLTGKRGRRGQD